MHTYTGGGSTSASLRPPGLSRVPISRGSSISLPEQHRFASSPVPGGSKAANHPPAGTRRSLPQSFPGLRTGRLGPVKFADPAHGRAPVPQRAAAELAGAGAALPDVAGVSSKPIGASTV
jgi:hypothetical protein